MGPPFKVYLPVSPLLGHSMGNIMAVTALFEALKQSRTMRLAMAGLALDNIPMLGMASGAT